MLLQAADITGQRLRLTLSPLEKQTQDLENREQRFAAFVQAAEAVWDELMSNPDCRDMGNFMLEQMRLWPVQARLPLSHSHCIMHD